MGSTVSKQDSKKDHWSVSLSRSASLATGSTIYEAKESSKQFSWKSRLSSMPKSSRKDISPVSGLFPSSQLNPIQEENGKEVLELSDENHTDVAATSFLSKCKRNVSFSRSISFQSNRNADSVQLIHEVESDHKLLKYNMVESTSPSPIDVDCGLNSTSSIPNDLTIDKSLGLRSLLKPHLMPSRSFAAPSRNVNDFNLTLSPNKSFNSRCNDGNDDLSARNKFSLDKHDIMKPEWMNSSDILLEGSDLFDPSILASFGTSGIISEDNWQSSDLSTSENVTSSSGTSSDADSPKLEEPDDVELFKRFRSDSTMHNQHRFEHSSNHRTNAFKSFRSLRMRDEHVFEDSSNHATNAFLSRQFPLSREFSLNNDKKDWNGQDYLNIFERRCPPWCEDKVVLYFTSLRGVRKTFEDCCKLRLIMKGFRVYVDERDVWMHSRYRQELTEVLGAPLPVPRLFVLGRYIGGVEEVEQLNEGGILAKMIEDLPTEWGRVCDVCGDVRFIPCITCSGSRKILSEDNMIQQCRECNENGLIMCPICK